MAPRGANQNRNCFFFRAATDCNYCLFLDLNVAIIVHTAGEGAQALLPRDAAEIRDRALPQLEIFFSFGNTNQVSCRRVAVVVARDTPERGALEFARSH